MAQIDAANNATIARARVIEFRFAMSGHVRTEAVKDQCTGVAAVVSKKPSHVPTLMGPGTALST